ncbi:hypothetical protein SH611_03130 [Geminicoccaceae bacterium 1502E]|nr:hypothetical protein [Geminicoccaceae bacterium 1502E]
MNLPPSPLALAVFEDRPERPALHWLAPGFRHCFCLLEQPEGWILCDPLRHRLHLDFLPAITLETLAGHFGSTGRRILSGTAGEPLPRRLDWLRPFTCVEAVKRALGVRAHGIWTPFQLFCHLTRELKFHDLAQNAQSPLDCGK